MTAPAIRLNPNLQMTRTTISGSQFCVVIDDFLADPHALIACSS